MHISDRDNWHALNIEASDIFSPSAPVDEDELLAGRARQRKMLSDSVLLRGSHAVLYGERGVGKTSLANVFSKNLVGANPKYYPLRVDCHPEDDYSSVWRKIFFKIPATTSDHSLALSSYYNDRVIQPEDVTYELSRIDSHIQPIIVIDEFDRLDSNTNASRLIADTIKSISNETCMHSISTTIIIVGVAQSVDEMIGNHESIHRNLAQIQLYGMFEKEIKEIINKRLSRIGMDIDLDALNLISNLSKGLPYYAHLFGLYSTFDAIDKKTKCITKENVDQGIYDCLERANHTTKSTYYRCIGTWRKNSIHKEVLLASALAKTDELRYFTPLSVVEPLTKILQRKVSTSTFVKHLKQFCQTDRRSILEAVDKDNKIKYRFTDPMMQPFVIMQGLHDKDIDKYHIWLALQSSSRISEKTNFIL